MLKFNGLEGGFLFLQYRVTSLKKRVSSNKKASIE